MRLRVLGSAAGGGVPQWNCGCENCHAARRGDILHRSQDSVAVSVDGVDWYLLNCSPDITRQIDATPALHPRPSGRRGTSPIAGVILTSGDLDHCLGLLSLREWTQLALYATQRTLDELLEHNAMLRTLRRAPDQLVARPLALEERTPIRRVDGRESGLTVRAFAVAGKVPLHLEDVVDAHPEHNVGLEVEEEATGRRVLYVPSAGSADGLAARAEGADALLFDGTFWSDDELESHGIARTARAMAHLPIGGRHGSLAALSSIRVGRKLFTHVNNTNPILQPDGVERRVAERDGWAVARDGMELWP